jgi:hypothetical protein
MYVFCVCCVLSGKRCLRRADHSSRGSPTEFGVSESREVWIVTRLCPTWGCCTMGVGGKACNCIIMCNIFYIKCTTLYVNIVQDCINVAP